MQILGAADEPDRGHAETVAVERLTRRCRDLGMIGEAEIIVGAQIDHFARGPALAHPDAPGLRADDLAFALGEALVVDIGKRFAKMVQEAGLHDCSLRIEKSIKQEFRNMQPLY